MAESSTRTRRARRSGSVEEPAAETSPANTDDVLTAETSTSETVESPEAAAPEQEAPAESAPDAEQGNDSAETEPAAEEPPTEEGWPTITVTLVQVGTGEDPFELPDASTVQDLLVEAGLNAKEGAVLVNSQHATLDTALPAGATVVFATNIQGGAR
jgi:sulfur carrier protein ThiS